MSVVAISAFILLAVMVSNAAAPGATQFDLSYLSTQFGQDAVNRFNSLQKEYFSRGLTTEQVKYALAQDLFESGLFTDVANYSLMNQNNYAGLTDMGGGYASYNSISDFVDAHLGFLQKGSDPIGAGTLSDFNNRLIQNHYYTENPQTYYNGLLTYYNLLS